MRSIDFEWQADGDSGRWEVIAQTRRRSKKKWPRWVWGVLAAVVLVSAAASYWIVRRRYEEANRQIAFQIQSLIDLEAEAWSKADNDLFMEQQDRAALDWFVYQTRCIQAERLRSTDRCTPVWPANLQKVDLQGDIAWVEVIEGNNPVRRMRTYRWTDTGWKRTAPSAAFWQDAIERRQSDLLTVRYHRRDRPYVDALVAHMEEALNEICAAVGCAKGDAFEVDFAIQVLADDLPRISGTKLTLASPWLSGIPIEGDWSEVNMEWGRYWLARMVAAHAIRSAAYPWPHALQGAIVDEYAAWFSTGDPAQAPILGRVIARQGTKALPEVFDSLKRSPTLTSFLGRWLALSPTSADRASVFFETLLNVEWEALVTGRRDTFLLLLDASSGGSILRNQATFDQFQSQPSRPTPLVLEVFAVDMANRDRVVVTFQARHPNLVRGQAVFISRDGDWKHVTPIILRPAFSFVVATGIVPMQVASWRSNDPSRYYESSGFFTLGWIEGWMAA